MSEVFASGEYEFLLKTTLDVKMIFRYFQRISHHSEKVVTMTTRKGLCLPF